MFKRLFNNYAVITRLNRQEKPNQLAVLLSVMGPTGVRLYDNLTFTEQEDKEDTTLIIRKIDAAIQGEINETYERYVFNRRNQGTEESFDSYLAEIRNLAKSCNFCDCMSDSLIRDRIVMGVYNAGMRKHLLQKRQLTLQAAMDICRSDEAATAQMTAEIHKIKKSHPGDADRQNSAWKPGNLRSQRTMQRRQNATYSDGDTKHTYKFCGRAHPKKKVYCPAWGRTCRRSKREHTTPPRHPLVTGEDPIEPPDRLHIPDILSTELLDVVRNHWSTIRTHVSRGPPPVQVRLQINHARQDRPRGSFEEHVPGTDKCVQE